MTQYAVFETAIGWAALAWNDRGLVGARLPQAHADTTRRALLKRFPEAALADPSAEIADAILRIQALMRGEAADLTGVRLDEARAPEFNRKVYEIARTIPPGETLTYGEIALRLGDRLLARDVGQALGQNPWPIVVPCHRVTAAGGKLGGFSAPGGSETKLKLLTIEGAQVAAGPSAQPTSQPSLFG